MAVRPSTRPSPLPGSGSQLHPGVAFPRGKSSKHRGGPQLGMASAVTLALISSCSRAAEEPKPSFHTAMVSEPNKALGPVCYPPPRHACCGRVPPHWAPPFHLPHTAPAYSRCSFAWPEGSVLSSAFPTGARSAPELGLCPSCRLLMPHGDSCPLPPTHLDLLLIFVPFISDKTFFPCPTPPPPPLSDL